MPRPATTLADWIDRVRALAPLVREHAAASEREAHLAPAVVEALHDAALFRIHLPASLGGGGLTLPEALHVYEETARLDGATGWNLSICAGGPLFGHFLARAAYDEIFRDPRAVVAGSLNPLGTRVVRDDGGWRFSGRSTYVSGSAQATWLMAAGLVEDAADGRVLRAGLLPMRHCRILDTWSTSGMRGTGSDDVAYDDVLVPDGFTYEWPDPPSPWRADAFARIPLVTQLGGSLAAVALGVARHAIDALLELGTRKTPTGTFAPLRDRPVAQIQVARAEGLLQAAHAYLHGASEEVWRRGVAGEPFDAPARAAARLASVTAAHLAAQAVDLVYDAAGTTAIQTSCDVERCWRDVHAITQHVILSTGRFEIVGRVLFGLPPGAPII